MCAAARQSPYPQRRGTLAPPYRYFTGFVPHVKTLSLRTSPRAGVAIRIPLVPHPIAFTSPFLPVPRKNIPIFPLDREKYLWYIHCTNTNNTLNTPKGGITRAAFGLSG